MYKSQLIGIKERSALDLGPIPIIIGLPIQANPNPWLKAGFNDVIRLPFNKELLATRLEVWLHIREESRLRLRALYENATLGLYRTTPEGEILLANPALVEMLGYDSFDDLKKRNLETEGFEPGYERKAFRRRLEKEEIVRGLESVWHRKDGSPIYVRESARVVKNSQGVILYYEGTVEDITEKKSTEDRLRKSEFKYRQLIENANEGIYIAQNGNLKFVNPMVSRITGYTSEELLSKPLIKLIHPKDQNFVLERHIKRIKGEDVPDTYEFRIINKEGKTKWLSIRSVRIDWEGQPATLNLSSDITERVLARQALRDSEERFRTLAESASMAILVYSGENLIYVNKAAQQLTGFSEAELLSQRFWDIVHPDFKELIRQRGQDRLKGKPVPKHHEFKIICKDGSERWIDFSSGQIIWKKEPAAIGTAVDITERKEAEHELKRLLKEKEVLLKEIHHRVKNNLQLISSMLSIQSEQFHDQKIQTACDETRARIRSIALIHESLYKSRNYSKVNFAVYLKNLTQQLFRTYRRPELELEVKVSKVHLPMDLAIPCGLVVNELITNALKHAFPERRAGKISVSFQRAPSRNLELVVADDGSGFPELERNPPSMGMDLVSILVKDQLKGRIHIQHNKGTQVTIQFPFSR